MDYKNKIRRNQVIATFLLTSIIIGCGGLIGFGNLLKSVLFVLPFIVLFPIGSYQIIMKFEGRKQFTILALWIGFVFAVTAVVGMLIDPRVYPINWLLLFSVAGISWIVVFLFVILLTPVYSEILRTWKRK